jgi:hypothetical protein
MLGGGVLSFVAYKANQDFIAANLCENRTEPQRHCNGKCYLTKKMEEAEKQDNQQEQTSPAAQFVVMNVHVLDSQIALLIPPQTEVLHSTAGDVPLVTQQFAPPTPPPRTII